MKKTTRKKVGYLEKKVTIFNFTVSDNEIFFNKSKPEICFSSITICVIQSCVAKKYANLLTIIIFM